LAAAVLDKLASKFNQHRRMLRLSTSAGYQALLAESLRGEEELSRGFRFALGALSLDAAIPLKSLMGQPVLVELLTDAGAGQFRPFHGLVAGRHCQRSSAAVEGDPCHAVAWRADLAQQLAVMRIPDARRDPGGGRESVPVTAEGQRVKSDGWAETVCTSLPLTQFQSWTLPSLRASAARCRAGPIAIGSGSPSSVANDRSRFPLT
jgi:hypothetical protein